MQTTSASMKLIENLFIYWQFDDATQDFNEHRQIRCYRPEVIRYGIDFAKVIIFSFCILSSFNHILFNLSQIKFCILHVLYIAI